MKRKDLVEHDNEEVQEFRKCKWYESDEVNQLINDCESKVNQALCELDDIKSVDDLGNIQSCRDILKELSLDLY